MRRIQLRTSAGRLGVTIPLRSWLMATGSSRSNASVSEIWGGHGVGTDRFERVAHPRVRLIQFRHDLGGAVECTGSRQLFQPLTQRDELGDREMAGRPAQRMGDLQ